MSNTKLGSFLVYFSQILLLNLNLHNSTDRTSVRFGGLPAQFGSLFHLHLLQEGGVGVPVGAVRCHVEASAGSAALVGGQEDGIGVGLDERLDDVGTGADTCRHVQRQPSPSIKRPRAAGTGLEKGIDGLVVGSVAESVMDGQSSQRVVGCGSLGIVLEQPLDDVGRSIGSAGNVQGDAAVGRLLLPKTHPVGLVQGVDDLYGRTTRAGNVNGQYVTGLDALEEARTCTPSLG